MSIKVVEYLVTKTRYSFLTRIPEGGNMLNIKTNIREYIFNSDLGSNTKKIENIFYPRFVFLLQIMLAGLLFSSTLHTQSCWGSGGLTEILFISGQNLKIKQTHSTYLGLACHFTTWLDQAGPHRSWGRSGHQEPKEKCQNSWSIPVMVMRDWGRVTPNTAQHEECDIIDCVGVLECWHLDCLECWNSASCWSSLT